MQLKYAKYYPLIEKANKTFISYLNKVKTINNFEEKHQALSLLLEFLTYHNAGIWTSSYIENFYIDWANKIDIENYNVDYKKNSFLHVITTGYKTGGHTRVVERWMSNAPDYQIHSAIFISPNDDNMSVIENFTLKKNGECVFLNNKLSTEEKALKLRCIALKYEYVILHTHMDDYIPLIAFGTEKFTRPVLLYNHASLMFWLGKGISDLVLDIVNNDEITKEKRKIDNSFFVGVPSKEIFFSLNNKEELRKKLSLPIDKKIIVSSASEHKYCIINNDSFADTLLKLIDENTYCYLIGIPKNNKYWKKINKKSKGHIIPLGYINFNEGFMDYLSSADLYLDSYPMTGGAAMIDAISRGIPALSLKTVDVQLDYFISTSSNCETKEDFIFKAKKILNDKNYAGDIVQELQKSLKNYQSIDAWNKRIEEMIEIAPRRHEVKKYNDNENCIVDDLPVLLNVMTDKHALDSKSVLKKIINQSYKDFIENGIHYKSEGIPYLFEILSYMKLGKKIKKIKIFGCLIRKITRKKD